MAGGPGLEQARGKLVAGPCKAPMVSPDIGVHATLNVGLILQVLLFLEFRLSYPVQTKLLWGFNCDDLRYLRSFGEKQGLCRFEALSGSQVAPRVLSRGPWIGCWGGGERSPQFCFLLP